MSTSGTTTFNLDAGELIEEAFERCGLEPRVGYDLKSARRSLNLLALEWASAGLNLWTVDQQTLSLVAGTATYSLPVDTIDVLDAVLRTNAGNAALQSDIVMSRVSFSTYSAQTNKLLQDRPIQFLVMRTATPTVTFWPIPDAAQSYQFVYYRMRRMQDITSVDNTEDIPFRFLPAIAAGLAYKIAVKKAPDRVQLLKPLYDQAFALAADEDRERASFRLVPRIGS